MVTVEEFADGIISVTASERWNRDALQTTHDALHDYVKTYTEPIYLLFHMNSITEMEDDALQVLLTSPDFGLPYVGMAIMVGRRGQLQQARAILDAHPEARESVQLRLMTHIEDAYRVLLDRQVMDKIDGIQRYGG
jgi:hypothetical protein